MDKTDRLWDYGLAFLLYEQGLGICGYELIRELFIFIKLILNSYLNNNVVDADLEVYLRVLGEEFLRNDFVDDRRYYISSVVGNHILNFCPSSSKVRKPLYDAVLYSSVVADNDNVFNKNIAMFPNIVDSSLDFYCVLKGELLEDLQTIRPLFIGRVEKSIIEWYKISVIVDLSNIHIVGVMHNGEREMFENEEEEPKSLFNPNRSLENDKKLFLMTAIRKTALYMLDS